MLAMNEDLEGALRHYMQLLDAGEYFEAHEVLEEAWHPLRLSGHPQQFLVKGLINAAICFEHIKRNRRNMPSKARRVIASYERYKHEATPLIEYGTLFIEACEKIEMLKQKHADIFQPQGAIPN
jgi:predicted metal-dependent hydrolase